MEGLVELRRRTFDTPRFRGIVFIEVEAKTVVNKVPPTGYLPFGWTLNPYRGCSHACAYCFARGTHLYMDMNAGRDFDTKIVVKVNAADVLRKQLRARRWQAEPIAMGTATDPYQRAEGRYRLMRGILRALIDRRNPFSILTKGTLILRDLDLLEEASAVADVTTALSIPTLDADVWRRSEPGTPHPRKRMEAVAKLNAAGIPCGVMLAPVMPGISDGIASLQAVIRAAVDAGATHITPIVLHLRPVIRDEFMPWLAENYPHLLRRYEATYRTSYVPSTQRDAADRRIAALVRAAGGPNGKRSSAREPGTVGPKPEQQSLSLG